MSKIGLGLITNARPRLRFVQQEPDQTCKAKTILQQYSCKNKTL